jgi:hypothetical protein
MLGRGCRRAGRTRDGEGWRVSTYALRVPGRDWGGGLSARGGNLGARGSEWKGLRGGLIGVKGVGEPFETRRDGLMGLPLCRCG